MADTDDNAAEMLNALADRLAPAIAERLGIEMPKPKTPLQQLAEAIVENVRNVKDGEQPEPSAELRKLLGVDDDKDDDGKSDAKPDGKPDDPKDGSGKSDAKSVGDEMGQLAKMLLGGNVTGGSDAKNDNSSSNGESDKDFDNRIFAALTGKES